MEGLTLQSESQHDHTLRFVSPFHGSLLIDSVHTVTQLEIHALMHSSIPTLLSRMRTRTEDGPGGAVFVPVLRVVWLSVCKINTLDPCQQLGECVVSTTTLGCHSAESGRGSMWLEGELKPVSVHQELEEQVFYVLLWRRLQLEMPCTPPGCATSYCRFTLPG